VGGGGEALLLPPPPQARASAVSRASETSSAGNRRRRRLAANSTPRTVSSKAQIFQVPGGGRWRGREMRGACAVVATDTLTVIGLAPFEVVEGGVTEHEAPTGCGEAKAQLSEICWL